MRYRARTAAGAASGNHVDIVIIDDQASARAILRHVIEDISDDWRVHDFGDPLVALSWCQHNHVDLLLLDYRMPGMNGLELVQRFRTAPQCHADVPILLISAVGDEPMKQAALEAGVTECLLKPIRPRELRARCRNLLQLRGESERELARSLHQLRRQAESARQLAQTLLHGSTHIENAALAQLALTLDGICSQAQVIALQESE